jgi:hypothetical protein
MVLSMPRRRVKGEKNITMSRSLWRLPADRKWTVEMENYFWVAVGGALGTMAPYWCSGFIAWPVGETFPWGTPVINVLGSFVIGFFFRFDWSRRKGLRRHNRQAIRHGWDLQRLHHFFVV